MEGVRNFVDALGIEALFYFVPAVFGYALIRLIFRLCGIRGGYGLPTDGLLLIAIFVFGTGLYLSDLRPKDCRAFAEILFEGFLATVAFVPSLPRLRKLIGKASPYAGLGLALATVALFYWFAPEDYSNPANCP